MISCKLTLSILHSVLTVPMFLDEKNPKLVDVYKGKMFDYLKRAEEIKTKVLKPGEPVSQGGGQAAASKPK